MNRINNTRRLLVMRALLSKLRTSYQVRLHSLFLLTAVVVAFVRNRIQYGSGFNMWDTMSGFAISLILHLLAIWFFSFCCAFFILRYQSIFVENAEELASLNMFRNEIATHSMMVYVTMTILLASILIGVLSFLNQAGIRFVDPHSL